MKTNRFASILCILLLEMNSGTVISQEYVEMTDIEAENKYTIQESKRVAVHDPSVTFDETTDTYYIFGSHLAVAKSKDLQNWIPVSVPLENDIFQSNQTKEIEINGEKIEFGNFNAEAWNCAIGNWTLEGNMWAPDIIYNPYMKKWCQYLSLNGEKWNSCIVLLTSDNIEGPYTYQGPVVFTGFRNETDESISFHHTDLEYVTGKMDRLPERYNKGDNWGVYWPHAIDPCVFFDNDKQLWMAYGSWSGGIYMLKLNKENGLRDYNHKYESDYDSKGANVSTDEYFGKKIAGGHYVSGEGPYIEFIEGYYYLFMSYGGYAPDGGYEMRIFRSENPDGPYTDMSGINAIFNSYSLNYGPGGDNRGEKILGAYNNWGFMTVGECAQGHNSVLTDKEGNTYLIYHTKFNNGTIFHEVRVHKLFVNKEGWLVASPFEYRGESIGNKEISTAQSYSIGEIPGIYDIMIHRYNMNHKEYEEIKPNKIKLNADGTIEGAMTGKWYIENGTSYINVQIGDEIYKGVIVQQEMYPATIKTISFSAVSNNGTNIWGYRMEDEYALAYSINNLNLPFKSNQSISRNIDLYGINHNDNVEIKWQSSNPDIISNTGKYNTEAIKEDKNVNLILNMSSGKYNWNKSYEIMVKKPSAYSGDFTSGLKGYYNFDSIPISNLCNEKEVANLKYNGSGKVASLEKDSARTGNIIHQYFGDINNNCYTEMNNPLYKENLEGFTVSMWIKRNSDIAWDAIYSFYNPDTNKRLYITGNTYIGYNDGYNWIDINYPNNIISDNIPVNKWTLVTITVSRSKGIYIYINGIRKRISSVNGSCNGSDIDNSSEFDYNTIVDHIEECPYFYLGNGSFWGSEDVYIDDILIYNRELNSDDIFNLNIACNRITAFETKKEETDIKDIYIDKIKKNGIFDLNGRHTRNPKQGIYIVNGKKQYIK